MKLIANASLLWTASNSQTLLVVDSYRTNKQTWDRDAHAVSFGSQSGLERNTKT